MTIDSFTAELALSTISNISANKNIEIFADILRGMKDNDPVPSEVVAFVENNIDKPVKVLGTSYKAVIHACNKSSKGFYPGIRYPVYVKITETSDERFNNAIGCIFEYGLEQIQLL